MNYKTALVIFVIVLVITVLVTLLYYNRSTDTMRYPRISGIKTKGFGSITKIPSDTCLDSFDCSDDRLCYNNYCIPRPITIDQKISASYNNKNITLNRHLLYLVHSTKYFSIFPSLWSLPRVIDVVECPDTKFGIIVLTDTGIYYIPNFTDNQCQPIRLGINDGSITQIFWYRRYLFCVSNYSIYQGPNITKIKSKDYIDRWDYVEYINGKDIRSLRIKMVSVPTLGLQDTIWMLLDSDNNILKYGPEDYMYLTITESGKLRFFVNNNLVFHCNNIVDAVVNPVVDDSNSSWSLVMLTSVGTTRIVYESGRSIDIETSGNSLKSTRDMVWLISKDQILNI
jgi:hypothetical protein